LAMGSIELRHLRYFVAVAEELHFARAAARLGIEQSPLSRQIRELEHAVGVPLFHRTTRRTWLSAAGQRFLDLAQRILADVELAKTIARETGSGSDHPIRLGLAEHAAGEGFQYLLHALAEGHPSSSVAVLELPVPRLIELTLDGRIDASFVLQPVDASGLFCEPAWAEGLAVLAPPDHPLAARTTIELRELTAEPLLVADPDVAPGYAGQVAELLRAAGIDPDRGTLVAHPNTMASLVAIGAGLGIMAQSWARRFNDLATVIDLVDGAAIMRTWMLYRDGDCSPDVSRILEFARLAGSSGGRHGGLPASSRPRDNVQNPSRTA